MTRDLVKVQRIIRDTVREQWGAVGGPPSIDGLAWAIAHTLDERAALASSGPTDEMVEAGVLATYNVRRARHRLKPLTHTNAVVEGLDRDTRDEVRAALTAALAARSSQPAGEVEWGRAFRRADGSLHVDDDDGAFRDADDVARFVRPGNPESPYDLIVRREVGPWTEVEP